MSLRMLFNVSIELILMFEYDGQVPVPKALEPFIY